jgi:putative transposase
VSAEPGASHTSFVELFFASHRNADDGQYECVFLNAFETGSEARFGIGRRISYYNTNRPHSSFGGRTPDEVYAIEPQAEKLAG